MSLGASGLQTFWRVTLPNVKWGLMYGVLLCNARAMGEFGAVSVVSGQHPRRDQHDAAACRDSLQRLSVRGGFCGGVVAGVAGAGHADHQNDPRMAVRRRTARPHAGKAVTMNALAHYRTDLDYADAPPSIVAAVAGKGCEASR